MVDVASLLLVNYWLLFQQPARRSSRFQSDELNIRSQHFSFHFGYFNAVTAFVALGSADQVENQRPIVASCLRTTVLRISASKFATPSFFFNAPYGRVAPQRRAKRREPGASH